MAIALKKRRIITAKIEATRGTAEVPVASSDAIPMIRDATFEITPVEVERPTLRLSLTDYPDIYPGKALVRARILAEVAGRDSGFPASEPNWTRLLRACGMRFADQASNVFAYKVTALTTNNGALRHGEVVSGTALAGTGNTMLGDNFAQEGAQFTTVFVAEGATPGTGAGTITSQRGSSETVMTVTTRSTNKCLAWIPQSDVNSQSTVSIGLYLDGKLCALKGAMGNVEYQFNHGDACLAQFDMQGVLVSYSDQAMPTNAFEGHKVPPTFLGSRLTLSSPINLPGNSDRYGTGGTAGFGTKGSLNQVRLSSGNNVVLQPNSLDPDGVSFALVTSRKPAGSFNPTEVLSASEFDFISRFVAGSPARMKLLLGATDHTNPNSADQNTFEFMAPGIVFSGMTDADRDGINIWDASFELSGGDYDSTALGEAPGNDNEFILVHR